MTTILSSNDQNYTNSQAVTGAPAFQLTGNNVRLLNQSSIASTDGSLAAIMMSGGGGVIENQAGGTISGTGGAPIAITGSNNSDIVRDSGLITGRVDLLDGDDSYTLFINENLIQSPTVNLGNGNDSVVLDFSRTLAGGFAYTELHGGAGIDSLTLRGDYKTYMYFVNPVNDGFEVLNLDFNGSVFFLSRFNDFQTINILSGTRAYFDFSLNSTSTTYMSGGQLYLNRGSSFGSIVGSSGNEEIYVRDGSFINGNVSLGDGRDLVYVGDTNGRGIIPFHAASLDGGAGTDYLTFGSNQPGNIIYLDTVTGFEFITFNGPDYSQSSAPLHIFHADTATILNLGWANDVFLHETNAPNTVVDWVGRHGSVTIEAESVIGSYGDRERILSLPVPERETSTVARDEASGTLINNGTILGDVRFDVGNDVYDGHLGTVGGGIYGYAGNDIIVAGSGADHIDGGAGIDLIFAGGGNDVIVGSGDGDVIDGGTGFDTLNYAGLARGYGVTRSVGDTSVRSDHVANVENITFKDSVLTFDSDSNAAFVMRLYHSVLGREPDAMGLDYWLDVMDRGQTRAQVADGFLGSPEFRSATGSLSSGDFVNYLYGHALGRTAGANEQAYWVSQLNSGASRADVLIGFSESTEHRGLTENILAKGLWVTNNNYQIVEALYDGLADRLPDLNGLEYWVHQLESGVSVNSVAAGFAASQEFAGRTAGFSNGQLVDYMYHTSLGRDADAGGKQYWVYQLDHGLTKGDLLLGFSMSAEHIQQIGGHLFAGVDYYG